MNRWVASALRGAIVAAAVYFLDGPGWAVAGLGLLAFYEFPGDVE